MSHKRAQEDKRRLKKLCDETVNHYAHGAYYNERKGRFIRFSPSDGSDITTYYKRRANKKLRGELLNDDSPAYRGADYRRVYDYRWEII